MLMHRDSPFPANRLVPGPLPAVHSYVNGSSLAQRNAYRVLDRRQDVGAPNPGASLELVQGRNVDRGSIHGDLGASEPDALPVAVGNRGDRYRITRSSARWRTYVYGAVVEPDESWLHTHGEARVEGTVGAAS
jgi:hypothetical protein